MVLSDIADLKYTLTSDKSELSFENVSRQLSFVVQCNVSNTYGYLLQNAHLIVYGIYLII